MAGGVAQALPAQTPAESGHLTVRPYEMATATQTTRTGEFPLDSLLGNLIYVPERCAGTRRCPLLIGMFGDTPSNVIFSLREVADEYGIIVLAPNPAIGVGWSVPDPRFPNSTEPSAQPDQKMIDNAALKNVDAALKQVLQRFAIAPDKIALLGRCAGGPASSVWGGDNLEVFSRILAVSGGYPPTATVKPPNKTTEFFLDAGLLESYGNFRTAQELRRAGHRVKHVLGLRGHEHQREDYAFIARWLQESWATPDPAARSAPSIVADPLPLLTPEAVVQMTAFWENFMREPDSIKTTARQAYLREVVVPIGEERPSVVMVDMAALAAKYPSVSAGLKKAGLTARQHDAYRVALISASVARDVTHKVSPTDSAAAVKYHTFIEWRNTPVIVVEATSVLGKNMAFMEAHSNELEALAATNMWNTP